MHTQLVIARPSGFGALAFGMLLAVYFGALTVPGGAVLDRAAAQWRGHRLRGQQALQGFQGARTMRRISRHRPVLPPVLAWL